MRRTLPISLLAALALLVAFAVPASAKQAPKACVVSSGNVIGKTVIGALSAENVEPKQASLATCAEAKKAIRRITALRVEVPKVVNGFRCVPTVYGTSPDIVSYRCVLRGADTALTVRLRFVVAYDLD